MATYERIPTMMLPDPKQQGQPLFKEWRHGAEEIPPKILVADSNNATGAQHTPYLHKCPDRFT